MASHQPPVTSHQSPVTSYQSPIAIGITGQAGFIGTHLYNYLGIQEGIEHISFEDDYFEDEQKLETFVKSCDVIVHLAALNRHRDPQVIYDTNIRLVELLINTCEATKSTPHILFSSSTQEDRDNLYGKSKQEGRILFEKWAEKNNAQFTGFIIPNVFGPFGNPFYNSVVATFCYQLTHHEQPKIDVDGVVKLVYVGELVQQITNRILKVNTESLDIVVIEEVRLQHTSEEKVSAILEILEDFKKKYLEHGEIPALDTPFRQNLFNTFVCYIDHEDFFPFKLKLNTDNRGSFVEIVKLNSGGQISFSTTKPDITRGNHFHTRKAERFAVIKGKARIEFRKIGTNKVKSFDLDGKEPSFVDMPIWYTHSITNTGIDDLFTIFWINEHYNPKDADTFFEKV